MAEFEREFLGVREYARSRVSEKPRHHRRCGSIPITEHKQRQYVRSLGPVYRSLVRQLIDVPAQEFYWANCWTLVDGIEEYVLNCPEGVSPETARELVYEITANPDIEPHLTEWIGAIVSLPQTLGDQNAAAQRAVDVIDRRFSRTPLAQTILGLKLKLLQICTVS